MPEQQTGLPAAVAVITEAFNTAHDPAPAEYPEFEKHRRHDGHIAYGGCDLCRGDVAKLAPYIADALTAAGLLASTPDRSMVDTIRQVLHDMEHGCREEPGGHQRLAEEIARRLRAQSTPDAPEPLDDMVDRMAGALREVTIDLGQTRIHLSGGERRDIALNTALVAFESPRWRQLAKEAHDAARRERAVYRERAQLVAVLAHFYPSVWSYSDPAEPEWPVVYIKTPQGQCSWHLSPEDVDLFGHIKQVGADDPRALWDGHSTVEKYRRLAELAGPDGGAGCSGVDEPSTVEDGGQP